MWSEKYRPKNILEMIGNEQARSDVVEWISKWKKGTKPILLVGPPGIGKTTIANIVAKQFGFDLISLNASDVRSKSRINEILSPVLGNVSVLGTPMIFVDEVDGIHGRADFGGVEALIKILKEPTVPIILAANSDITTKMKSIKKTVKTIYFKQIPPRLLKVYLELILKKENATLSLGSIIRIISQSRGDIRSMINLAQAVVTGFIPPSEKSLESINVEEGVNSFFKAKTLEEARSVMYSMDIDPRDKINAFYSSLIISQIDNNQLRKSLEILSKADMLYGKIMKTQQWRLLRYLNEILVELFLPDSNIRYSAYNLSWPLLNRIRWDGKNLKTLCKIMSRILHVSVSSFATFYFPYILFLIKNKKIVLEMNDTFSELISKEMAKIK